MKIFIGILLLFILIQNVSSAPVDGNKSVEQQQLIDTFDTAQESVSPMNNDTVVSDDWGDGVGTLSVDDFILLPSQEEKQDTILPTDESIEEASDDKDSMLIYLTNFIAPDIIGLHKAEMENPTMEQLYVDKHDFQDDLNFATNAFKFGDEEEDLRFTQSLRIQTEHGFFMAPWPEEELVKGTPLLLSIETALQEEQKVRLQRIAGYLNKTPSDKDGYNSFLKWVCYLGLNDMENAKKSLIDLILTRISNSKRIYWWNYMYLGRLDFILGNYSKAVLSFKQALEMNPDRASLYLYAGRASLRAEQPSRARRYYMLALEKAEDEALRMHIVTFLSEFYASRDEWEKILELVKPYIEHKELRPSLVLHYIRALRQQDRIDEIEGIFKQRIAIDPENELWYFNLAQFYWGMDQKDQAITLLADKYESDPSLVGIGMRLARYNRLQGNVEQTIAILQKIIADKPDAVIAIIRLARLYYSRSQWAESGELFKKALDKNPDNPEIIFFLGKIYEHQKQYNIMREYFELYLEKFPQGTRIAQVKASLDKLSQTQEGM